MSNKKNDDESSKLYEYLGRSSGLLTGAALGLGLGLQLENEQEYDPQSQEHLPSTDIEHIDTNLSDDVLAHSAVVASLALIGSIAGYKVGKKTPSEAILLALGAGTTVLSAYGLSKHKGTDSEVSQIPEISEEFKAKVSELINNSDIENITHSEVEILEQNYSEPYGDNIYEDTYTSDVNRYNDFGLPNHSRSYLDTVMDHLVGLFTDATLYGYTDIHGRSSHETIHGGRDNLDIHGNRMDLDTHGNPMNTLDT